MALLSAHRAQIALCNAVGIPIVWNFANRTEPISTENHIRIYNSIVFP